MAEIHSKKTNKTKGQSLISSPTNTINLEAINMALDKKSLFKRKINLLTKI